MGLPLALAFGLLTAGCSPKATHDGGGNGTNYIIEVQGVAEKKIMDQTAFYPAYGGDFLQPSTQLRVGAGSTVEVMCNDGRPRSFSAGTYTVGDYWLLDEPQPLIRWNPVVGAQRYTVHVSGPEVAWSRELFSGSQVTYDGPPLRPDERYRIVITADTQLSSSADEPVGFTLLSAAEVARVKAQAAALQTELRAAGADADAEALGLALLYHGYQPRDPEQGAGMGCTKRP